MNKLLFIVFAILSLNCCIKSKPPELRSPCTAGEAIDAQNAPCIRKPVNFDLG